MNWSLFLATVLAGTTTEPAWLRDYEQARVLARLTGRPLFVVFRCEH